MALEAYRKKRNFAATPEPAGRASRKAGDSFVIQKHDATRLHYDFRLEMDGVLKSWAVTRGPSLIPGDKRLAVHVEDHPLEYGDFEGTIPKGEYGGGTVVLWDRGTWKPLGDPHEGYAKGHLEFELHGEKLGGRWRLVRMARRPREKRENWLLIKGDDDFAREKGDPDILEERPESVKTGRVVEEIAGEAPGWSSKTGKITKKTAKRKAEAARAQKAERKTDPTPQAAPLEPGALKGAKKAAMPAFVEPTLATLASSPPAGKQWIHEIKFDGYRLQARIEAGRVKLLTRSGLDWTKKFGKEIIAALQELPVGKAIFDGELVSESAAGASDFSALQADLSAGRVDRFAYYIFDVFYLDGYDLRRAPLIERKTLVESLLQDAGPLVRYSAHFEQTGSMILEHACRLSLEGVVSKLRDAPHRPGRDRSWIKSKCSARQEFVVGGYIPSTTSKRAIGSLALGVYKGKSLTPVGRVGTGFSAAAAEDLYKACERLRSDVSPFARPLNAEEARHIRYMHPEMVVEVEFRAWTGDGNLRHASFRGVRDDKAAEDIVRENGERTSDRAAPSRPPVKLTHPDRLYWPQEGVTKEGLADYYTQVWRLIAPFIVGRPLALLRCPNGIEGERFFQKHAWKGAHRAIRLLKDPTEPGEEPLISIDSLEGLIGLVQAAALEIHPWGSAISDWERPDQIVIDLDPGEGVSWDSVIEAARETRQRLEAAGLTAFIKTSGGKGLHVCAPLQPRAEWPEAKAFTKSLAESMAADSPQKFVATITKSKRRGKILIDYLRNQRGATAVAPYSPRARAGAPVSMPLQWDELSPAIGPAYFTILNAPTRLAAQKHDPWEGFRRAAAPLSGARKAKAAKRKA